MTPLLSAFCFAIAITIFPVDFDLYGDETIISPSAFTASLYQLLSSGLNPSGIFPTGA